MVTMKFVLTKVLGLRPSGMDVVAPRPDVAAPRPDVAALQPDVAAPRPDMVATPRPDVVTDVVGNHVIGLLPSGEGDLDRKQRLSSLGGGDGDAGGGDAGGDGAGGNVGGSGGGRGGAGGPDTSTDPGS